MRNSDQARRGATSRKPRNDAARGVTARLALWLAQPDSLRRSGCRIRAVHLRLPAGSNNSRHSPRCGPNLFRQGRFLSTVELRSGRQPSPRRGSGNGAYLFPRWICISSRRCGTRYSPLLTSPYQLHGPSVAHSPRRFCGSLRGAQRLGGRPRFTHCPNSRLPAAYPTASPS
jgi:hypothetical protein